MGQTRETYIALIREDLDDYQSSNRLLGFEEEFTVKNIARACDRALDRFNTFPPLIGTWTFEQFESDTLFIDMAIYALLQRTTFKRGRNNLRYTESGNSIDDQNFAEYQALKKELKEDTKADMTRLKMALNLKRGIGYVSSPYRNL